MKNDYRLISDELVDRVVCDVLNGNGEKYSFEYLCSVITSLTCRFLKDFDINYEVIIMPQEEIKKISRIDGEEEEISAYITLTSIFISEESVMSFKSGKIDVINDIMHEVRHAKQRNIIDSNEISYENYLFSLEQIVQANKDNKYYQSKYWYLFDEIDARKYSYIDTYKYIRSIDPVYADKIFSDTINDIRNAQEDFNEAMSSVDEINREEELDLIVYQMPEYIEIYPILTFFFNEDGTKVSAGTILKRMALLDKKDALFHLYLFQLKNRGGSKKNVLRDLESLYDDSLIKIINDNELLNLIREDLLILLGRKIDSNVFESNYVIVKSIIKKEIKNFKKYCSLLKLQVNNISLKIYNGLYYSSIDELFDIKKKKRK